MKIARRTSRCVALCTLTLTAGCLPPERMTALAPRETPIVINGTDQTATPLYYRNTLGFGPRVAFKIVEHGDTTFFDEKLNFLETPHIDWADHYANGPVRVLFITNPQRQLRHPIELMQRSDFDIVILQVPGVLGEYAARARPANATPVV